MKPYILNKPLGKCLLSSKRGLIPLFLYPPLTKIFLVQITHGLLNHLGISPSKPKFWIPL